MASIDYNGILIPYKVLHGIFGDKIREVFNKLTLKYQPKKGRIQTLKMYRVINGANGTLWVQLPRSMAGLAPIATLLTAKWPVPRVWENAQRCCVNAVAEGNQSLLACELVPMQQIIVNHITAAMLGAAPGHLGITLNLRAGYGKTFVAAGIIAKLAAPTCYVVLNSALAHQARKDLTKALTANIVEYSRNPPKKKQLVGTTDADAAVPLVTIIIINTARELPASFFAQFDLIIYDEVQCYCSPENSHVFFNSCARYTLALSATTNDRKDNFDPFYYKWVGPVLNATDIAGFAYDDVRFDVRVRLIAYYGAKEYTRVIIHPSTDGPFTPEMVKLLCEDPARNAVLYEELKSLYDWRGPEGQLHNIFVFCEERAPIGPVIEAAARLLGIPTDLMGNFVGGTNDQTQQAIREGCRVIFTTYAFSATGLSIPKMTAMILYNPRRAKMVQLFGRIQRRGSDESIPRVIVDIWDKRNPVYRAQLSDRLIGYEYYGATIEKIKADGAAQPV